jgi:hypothetical protein
MATATKTRKGDTGRKTTARAASSSTAAHTRPDHPDSSDGQQEEKRAWSAEGMAWKLWRDTCSTTHRTRRQWMPHLAAAVVLGTGLGAQAIAAAHWTTPAAVASDTAMLAYPAALLASRKVRKRRPAWSRRVLVGGLSTATWLTLSPYGVGLPQIEILIGMDLALAARWWQASRIPYPGPPPTLTGDPATDADATDRASLTPPEQIIADWDEHLASKGGPAEGSRLWLPEETEHGWAFDLILRRGRQTVAELRNQLAKVASGLDIDVADLILEDHPLLKAPHRGRLQVITDSPITGDINFTGPRRIVGDDGSVLLELGPYADGAGEALWRLYTPGSMWSGVIIGGTGIGKSRVVENIVISALSGGDTEFWYIDPNRGGSSPALAKHADWFANADNADDVLNALLDILDGRGEENAYEGWTGFTPSPARPGLLVVVEECHRIFTPESAALWARVAREGRKLGVALLAISQYPGLETFGTKEALRSSVMEGNALVLRSTSNQTKQLMAGLELDPKTLPKIPGYAYTIGSEETGIRTAPFRNRNTDPDRTGTQAMTWLAAQPRPGLDTLTVTATEASGTAYADRNTSNTSSRTASAQRVAALRGGHLPAATGGTKNTSKTSTAKQTAAGLPAFPAFPSWGDPAPAAASKVKTDLDQLARDIAAARTSGASDSQVAALHARFAALKASALAETQSLTAGMDDTQAALAMANMQIAALLAGSTAPITPPAPQPASSPAAAARAQTAAPATTTVVQKVELTDSQRAVLDAVIAGAITPAEVREVVPLSPRQVQTVLGQLVACGLLTQPKYGRYQAA